MKKTLSEKIKHYNPTSKTILSKLETYENGKRDGIQLALDAMINTKRTGCLCTLREPCDGSCNPTLDDYINSIKKINLVNKKK